MDVQLSLWHSVFNFFWYIPRNGNTGGSSFNFLKNFWTVFHSVCTNLHFHQQWKRSPFSPHSLQHLLSLLFLMTKWWGNLLWFWHAFLLWLLILSIFWCMCWPFVYIFYGTCLFRSFIHFLIRLLGFVGEFLLLSCISSLFWILTPDQIYGLQMFSTIPQVVVSFCWSFLLLFRGF